MKGTIAITVALALLLSSPVSGPTRCSATPIQWDGNGHWYELVQERLTWDQARAAAESMAWFGFSGHLATVTSSEENAYVFWTVCAGTTQAWLGGYQDPPESQPAENWHWVTGEPWEYSHWLSGEPNDFFGAYSESCLQYSMALDGTWNDLPNDGGQPAYLPYTFVVEYAGPLTGVDHDVVLETSVALCATPNPFDDDLLLTYRLGDKTMNGSSQERGRFGGMVETEPGEKFRVVCTSSQSSRTWGRSECVPFICADRAAGSRNRRLRLIRWC
jgi:hypothetical protein